MVVEVVDVDDRLLIVMRKYGGSFVRNLVALYLSADAKNRRKIENCFGEYFEYYRKNFLMK